MRNCAEQWLVFLKVVREAVSLTAEPAQHLGNLIARLVPGRCTGAWHRHQLSGCNNEDLPQLRK
jgi:hypothetical protein